jgi:hypothetical protein
MSHSDSWSSIDWDGSWSLQWEPPHSAGDCAGRMHFRTGFGPFTEADGSARGLHIVWSSNPNSADYHPRYFNRARRHLESKGKACPPADIGEESRRLRDR